MVRLAESQEKLGCDNLSLSNQTAKITAILIHISASALSLWHSCKNSVLSLVSWFCVRCSCARQTDFYGWSMVPLCWCIKWKSSTFINDRCWMHGVYKMNFGSPVLWTGSYCVNLSKSYTLLEESEQDCSFQQDGAIVHTVDTTPFLQDFLPDYTIRFWSMATQSPHLTPLQILCDFVKEKVYSNSTRSPPPKSECTCLQESGWHFQHLL